MPEMLTGDEFRAVLADAIKSAGSQTKLAKEIGVSLAYINDVLNGRREAGLALLLPLGFERVVLYRRIQAAHERVLCVACPEMHAAALEECPRCGAPNEGF